MSDLIERIQPVSGVILVLVLDHAQPNVGIVLRHGSKEWTCPDGTVIPVWPAEGVEIVFALDPQTPTFADGSDGVVVLLRKEHVLGVLS